jgi:hypothetical protein
LTPGLLILATTVVAQAPRRFDLSAYERVTTGFFANYTYPAEMISASDGPSFHQKSIRLQKGIFEPMFDKNGFIERTGAYLKSVSYADLTGDRKEEAIVTLGNICDCSAVFFGVHIFDIRPQPRLLWSFVTGDRAVGGLRHVYGSKGDLVVELYGIGSGPDVFPKDYQGAWCCTDDYTRRRYRWNGKRFIQHGKAQLLIEKRSS